MDSLIDHKRRPGRISDTTVLQGDVEAKNVASAVPLMTGVKSEALPNPILPKCPLRHFAPPKIDAKTSAS